MNTFTKISLVLFLSLVVKIGYTQNPGNVGTANLTAWFKADSLAQGDVTDWNSSFPNGANTITFRDTTGAPYPQATNTNNGVLNYNNAIDFAGNSATNILTLGKSGAVNLINNNTSTSAGTFIMVYYLPTYTATGGHMLYYRESGGDGIQYRHISATTTRCAIGTTNSANGCRDYTEDFKPMIFSYTGNKSGAATMSAFKRSLLFTSSSTSATTGDNGVLIGARVQTNVFSGFFEGFVGEVLFYNSTLNSSNLNKVHTYLALKYGITLDNTGGGTQGNYISPNGKNIWNAAINSTYHNNIIGIGREDREGLYQNQSHTIDDSTRIYLDFLATNNSSNTSTIFNDSSYIIIGSNKGKLSSTKASSIEKPSIGVFSRLEREWKLTNSNFLNNFIIDIKLDSEAVLFPINPADLCLLVDDDGNFNNATVYTSAFGLSFSYLNGVITVSANSNTQFPLDSIRYFTIGSTNINSALPVKFSNLVANLNNDIVNLKWSTYLEQNNDYFSVERNNELNQWEVLSKVKSKGNSNIKTDYSFNDFNQSKGSIFYRIKQTDFDGKYTYSNIVSLNTNTYNEFIIYPSISNYKLTIKSTINDLSTINIVNEIGKEFTKKITMSMQSDGTISIDISNLLPGTYFVIFANKKSLFLKY
jgi:hypothetical protein